MSTVFGEGPVPDETAWDSVGSYQDEIVSLAHRPAAVQIRAAIAEADPAGRVVADIGCGPGHFLQDLAAATRIHAFDWSTRMLSEARTRAPAHTVFHKQDLRELEAPDPVDVALCLNAIHPVDHCDAQAQLRRVLGVLKPAGTLILVLMSMESRLYVATIAHHVACAAGASKVSLEAVRESFSQDPDLPLGYVLGEGDWVQKLWLADEAETLLHEVGAKAVQRFKAPVLWTDYASARDWQRSARPPWHWGFVVRK